MSCETCGISKLDKQQHDNFIKDCEDDLTNSGGKNKDAIITSVAAKYSIGKVSGYTILSKHEILEKHKPPTKPKKVAKGSIIILNEEEREKLVDIWEENQYSSYKELAKNKVLGDRTPKESTIYKILKEEGITFGKSCKPNVFTPIQEDAILIETQNFFIKEKSVNERANFYKKLANQYNVTVATIRTFLKVKGGYSTSRTPTEYEILEILDDYQELGWEKTCEKYKTSHTTLTRWRIDRGFEARDNSDSYRKYKLNQNYFENLDSSEKAYWIGEIGGDGSVYKHIVTLDLARIDRSHIEKFRNALETDKPIYDDGRLNKRNGEINESSRLIITCKKIASDLKKYGITANKSFTCDPNLDLVPEKFHRDLFRGFIDADGSYFLTNKKYPTVELCGSLATVEKFASYIKKILGFDRKTEPDKNIFRVRYQTSKEAILIAKHFHENCDICLDRKKEILIGWLTNPEISRFLV